MNKRLLENPMQQENLLFLCANVQIDVGSSDAQESAASLRAIREQNPDPKEPVVAHVLKMTEIHELEIAAVVRASEGNLKEAINIMRRAH